MVLSVDLGSGQSLRMLDRDEWWSREVDPSQPQPQPQPHARLPVSHVVLVSTGTRTCLNKIDCARVLQQIQFIHRHRGSEDINYNFMIVGDSLIYKGRGFEFRPRLDPDLADLEDKAISIGFVGDFTKSDPPFRMMSVALDCIKIGIKQGFISPNFKLIPIR